MHLASASGNVFGYLWAREVPPTFEGPRWARSLCARGLGFGLDGLFLLHPPVGDTWILEHWDTDGAYTFCSNGTRAALALLDLPPGRRLSALSSGEPCEIRSEAGSVALRLPEGPAYGLKPLPDALGLDPSSAAFGFIGNPQLSLRVPAVEAVDLPALAPPLRHHPALAGGTNVNVVEVTAPGEARIRSWERGVEGETLCCGTGCSVTAAWLARDTGVLDWRLQTASGDPVRVSLAWASPDHWTHLWLSGPVRLLGTVTLGPAFDQL